MLRLGPDQLRDCLPYLERCVDDEQVRVEVETELDSEQRRFLASLRSPFFENLTKDLSAQDTTLFSYVSDHKLREILD